MVEETKYHKGDVVTINNIDWTIDSVVMRFGRIMTYGLKYKDRDGERNQINIETGSLEALIEVGENK